MSQRCIIQWQVDGVRLSAFEPTPQEVRSCSPRLASFYNDTYNRAMMAHELDMSAEDVELFYRDGIARGDRLFFLEEQGDLVGDADLRHFRDHSAEFAIMVGVRSRQGKGLGRRFAMMVHAFALQQLDLNRAYVTILPTNLPSIGLFRSLGYVTDDGPAARALADSDCDVCMSIDRSTFHACHREALSEIHVGMRDAP